MLEPVTGAATCRHDTDTPERQEIRRMEEHAEVVRVTPLADALSGRYVAPVVPTSLPPMAHPAHLRILAIPLLLVGVGWFLGARYGR